MKNKNVQKAVEDCKQELKRIADDIRKVGKTASLVPYLNKYALIRACGTVELSIKTIIVEHCEIGANPPTKSFLSRNIKDRGRNFKYEDICKYLKEFDPDWAKNFKLAVDTYSNKQDIIASMTSLIDARNQFAHCGNPTASIVDVKKYFRNACRIIYCIDKVVK